MNIESIRENTVRILSNNSIPYSPNMPLISDVIRSEWKTAKEISERLIILYAITGLAHEADPAKLLTWLENEGLKDGLEGNEESYFLKDRLDKKDIVKLSWSQESLLTLAWSLGLHSELPTPSHEANLSLIFNKIPPVIDARKFILGSRCIEKEKIIQQLDVYYCYHWAVRHPEKWNTPISINLDIVIERRRALEWIVSKKEFYDISLDT